MQLLKDYYQHCKYCGKIVAENERYCCDQCKRKREAILKYKEKYENYFYIFALILFVLWIKSLLTFHNDPTGCTLLIHGAMFFVFGAGSIVCGIPVHRPTLWDPEGEGGSRFEIIIERVMGAIFCLVGLAMAAFYVYKTAVI